MMKKTLLSTTITVILSLSSLVSFANSDDDWEKELNKVSQDFSDLDVEMGDISNLLLDSGATLVDIEEGENDEQVKKAETIAKEEADLAEKAIAKAKEEKARAEAIKKEMEAAEEAKAVEIAKVEENDVIEFTKIETTSRNKEIMSDETDFVFLRNVPEGTRLTVKESYTVLPKKKFIIFSEGERVMKSPQTKANPEANFCFIELVNSGSARILKAGKPFIVTSNKTEVKDYRLNRSYGDYFLRTYQTVYGIDNKSVKNFTCYSSETYQKGEDAVPRPLTLKNLKEATGGVFKIDFPAYEEI